MKFLAVHPGPLFHTKAYLRLEPLGLELVAGAARDAGHEVGLIDLQVESHKDLYRLVDSWRPDVIAFSCNYLANVPEIVDLAKAIKRRRGDTYIAVGGHSVSFIAQDVLAHGEGAIDCILKGEGEASVGPLLLAVEHDRKAVCQVPGAVTMEGEGPAPLFVDDLDNVRPARDLLRHRHKYFIGVLDPCASIEFSRGCPWDCSFCSAWTFYGRSYRRRSSEHIVEDLERTKERGIFIVDDVSFIQSKHGFEIGEAIASKGLDKRYSLETRGDVLIRNKEVFRYWKKLGVKYLFLGLEAIDEEGLRKYRKRITLSENFEALEVARELDFQVAVNIIAEPDWDARRFQVVGEWGMEVPEFVNISINTPYPGTESWLTETRGLTSLDYRLFDIQHAVLPTKMPLPEYYKVLTDTQKALSRKHIGLGAVKGTIEALAKTLGRGQTNFAKMIFKSGSLYDPDVLLAEHARPVEYAMTPPPPAPEKVDPKGLYIHAAAGRKGRAIDEATERFVDQTRVGTSA
jgi:hopanoid C-3 methylase HpnR